MKLQPIAEDAPAQECHFCHNRAQLVAVGEDSKCDCCGKPIVMCGECYKQNAVLNALDQVITMTVKDMSKPGYTPRERHLLVQAGLAGISVNELGSEADGETKH